MPTKTKTKNASAAPEVRAQESPSERLVETIADIKGRLTMYRFVKKVDDLINKGATSDELWNYCVEHRREALAKAEGRSV